MPNVQFRENRAFSPESVLCVAFERSEIVLPKVSVINVVFRTKGSDSYCVGVMGPFIVATGQ